MHGTESVKISKGFFVNDRERMRTWCWLWNDFDLLSLSKISCYKFQFQKLHPRFRR